MAILLIGISTSGYENWLWFPVVLVLFILLMWMYRKKKVPHTQLHLGKKIIVPIMLLVLMQILCAIFLRSDHSYGWDYDIILMLSRQYVQTGTMQDATYLAVYPNNALYFWLVTGIFKMTYLFTGTCSETVLLLFNVLVLDISIWGAYQLTILLLNKKVAAVFMAIAIFFLPYWIYLPIAYTDIFAMPFFVFPLLMFARYIKRETSNKIYLIGAAILGAIGYFFKGTPVIVIIAVAITIIMMNLPLRKKIWSEIILVGIFLITFFLVNMMIPKLTMTTEEQRTENKTPIEYWLYTGLKNDGGWGPGSWNEHVVAELSQYADYDEKKIAARQKIAAQMKEYGCIGLVKHIYQKETEVVWGKGDLNGIAYLARAPRFNKAVQLLADEHRVTGKLVKLYADSYWIVLILLAVIALFTKAKSRYTGDASCVLPITAFGVFLFYILWESNARYLVCNVFLILILASEGLVKLKEAMGRAKKIDT